MEVSKFKGKGVVCYVPLDPAARNVPLGGKYKFTYALTAICTFLFIQLLIHGGGLRPISENPLLGPSILSLIDGGGLSQNLIRDGQYWRLIWAGLLHAGWLHLLVNIIVWIPLGKIIEPEWGFLRYGLCFFVSAVTGCLLSATLDGVNVSVGASGGIYGVMMGLNVYILEYWSTIPRANIFMLAAVISSVIAIAGSFMPMVDAYAHIGGAVGGLLFSLATLKRWDVGVGETYGRGWQNNLRQITERELAELEEMTYEDDYATGEIDERPTALGDPERQEASEAVLVESTENEGAHQGSTPNRSDPGPQTAVPESAVVSFAEKPIIMEEQMCFERPAKLGKWKYVPGVKHYLSYQERKYVPDGTTHFTYLVGRGTTACVSKSANRPRRVVINAAARRTSLRRTRVLALRPAKFEHGWGLWITRALAALLLIGIWTTTLYLLVGCPGCYVPPGQPIQLRRTVTSFANDRRMLLESEARILI